MLYDIYCVGMRVEKYVGMGPGEESFDLEPCEYTRYNLFCTACYGRAKFLIVLENEKGWCGSGYCAASYGTKRVVRVEEFGPMTHKLREDRSYKLGLLKYTFEDGIANLVLDEDEEFSDRSYDTGVFSYEDYGDEYYPYSFITVNMDLFEELPRAMKKRPVWIFTGNPGLGKSTLGMYLSRNYTVYETDSSEDGTLPSEIWADIVVLGNKKWKRVNFDFTGETFRQITLEDVKPRIPDAEIIVVNFEKSEEGERE